MNNIYLIIVFVFAIIGIGYYAYNVNKTNDKPTKLAKLSFIIGSIPACLLSLYLCINGLLTIINY